MYRTKTLPVPLKQAIKRMISQNNFPNQLVSQITRQMASISLQRLLPTILNNKSVFSCIKILILIHNIMLYGSKNKDQSIDRLLQAVEPTVNSDPTSFEKMLYQKLVAPYKFYLQKRNLYNEAQINRQSKQNHPYILINLMQSGLSFISILFTLGRYLLKQYKFLSEFNVILAKDMSMLYQKLKNKMSEQFRQIHAYIIETINQSLFAVFYNCYFSKYVCCYAPIWIDTDKIISDLQQQSRITLKKSRKMNCSYKQLDRLSFQCESSSSLSICCLESNDSSVLDFKSTSTIASLREVHREDPLSQKQIKQRLDFIASASSLLNQYRQPENIQQETITSLTTF